MHNHPAPLLQSILLCENVQRTKRYWHAMPRCSRTKAKRMHSPVPPWCSPLASPRRVRSWCLFLSLPFLRGSPLVRLSLPRDCVHRHAPRARHDAPASLRTAPAQRCTSRGHRFGDDHRNSKRGARPRHANSSDKREDAAADRRGRQLSDESHEPAVCTSTDLARPLCSCHASLALRAMSSPPPAPAPAAAPRPPPSFDAKQLTRQDEEFIEWCKWKAGLNGTIGIGAGAVLPWLASQSADESREQRVTNGIPNAACGLLSLCLPVLCVGQLAIVAPIQSLAVQPCSAVPSQACSSAASSPLAS